MKLNNLLALAAGLQGLALCRWFCLPAGFWILPAAAVLVPAMLFAHSVLYQPGREKRREG